ncbi:MAG: response regulator [Pirellulaceae bacterium]
MNSGYDYKKLIVLYVDDEAQSLKYFQRGFGNEFRVETAENVDVAIDFLKQHGNDVGVLLSDQRMPGAQGTELLQFAKTNFPMATRILVTAYSDLDAAVDSVNTGGAFRYLTKPWDSKELTGTLMRALEYSLLQRERNELLAAKLGATGRTALRDQVRNLATALGSHFFSQPNLATAIQQYVLDALRIPAPPKNPEHDPWSASRDSTMSLIHRLGEMYNQFAANSDSSSGKMLDGQTLVGELSESITFSGNWLNQSLSTTDAYAQSIAATANAVRQVPYEDANWQIESERWNLQLNLKADNAHLFFGLVFPSSNFKSLGLLPAYLNAAFGGKVLRTDWNESSGQLSINSGPAKSGENVSSGWSSDWIDSLFTEIEEAI